MQLLLQCPGRADDIHILYDSSRSDDWGLCTDEIIILSDNETPVTMPVSLTAILNEDFSKLTPEQREKPRASHCRPMPSTLRRCHATRFTQPK